MSSRAVQLTEVLPEAAIPYAPFRKNLAQTDAGDVLEITGRTIVELLNQAAEAADANTTHALDFAHKLSRQLRVAEERVIELEADLTRCKDRAERAEMWLNIISSEIEQKFFGSTTASEPEANSGHFLE